MGWITSAQGRKQQLQGASVPVPALSSSTHSPNEAPGRVLHCLQLQTPQQTQGCWVSAKCLDQERQERLQNPPCSATARHAKSRSQAGALCLLLQSLPDTQILLAQDPDSFLIKGFVFLLQQGELLRKLLVLLLALEVLEHIVCLVGLDQTYCISFHTGMLPFPPWRSVVCSGVTTACPWLMRTHPRRSSPRSHCPGRAESWPAAPRASWPAMPPSPGNAGAAAAASPPAAPGAS